MTGPTKNQPYLLPSECMLKADNAETVHHRIRKKENIAKGYARLDQTPAFSISQRGDTVSKCDGFRQWLTNHGYQSGAVSIDASDWYYNKRYLGWRAGLPDDDP